MIDLQGILSLRPHRYPFLMVDRVLEVDPGVRLVALKNVTRNEPWVQGHFVGRPIVPGVLLTEAFAQVAGLAALTGRPDLQGRPVYLVGMDGVRFRRPVVPGDQIHFIVEKEWLRRGIWRFNARAEVEGKIAAEGVVMATVAEATP